MFAGMFERTIVSALSPCRYEDSFTEIWLKVWFEELSEPVVFCATPFDCERHGKVLWIMAMRGDFGPITVVPGSLPKSQQPALVELIDPPKLLEYHGQS
jgi:hypothetical protein